MEIEREPIYDDIQLDQFRDLNIRELIQALNRNGNELCEKIADLRREVNRLHRQLSYCRHENMSTYQELYPDIYENIFMDFSGFEAFEEFKDEFEE